MAGMRAPTLTEFDALVVISVGVPVLILPPAVKAAVLAAAATVVGVHSFTTPGWWQRALIAEDPWRNETPGS